MALLAQRVDRSVLDAGLLVLSFAAGPVLGAFLVGVLTERVRSTAMLAGMLAGTVAVTVLWWTGAAAWTWYSAAGVLVTGLVALVASAAQS
jgi:Na+/proline symporter